MQQYGHYARFFQDLTFGALNQTFRGSYLGHEEPDKIDPNTGEVLTIEITDDTNKD